ncbi:MAG: hypothetical protein ACC700_17955 [Anaerolineales bacterium]
MDRIHQPYVLRRQGFIGPALLPIQELEYSAYRDSLGDLESQFSERVPAGGARTGEETPNLARGVQARVHTPSRLLLASSIVG